MGRGSEWVAIGVLALSCGGTTLTDDGDGGKGGSSPDCVLPREAASTICAKLMECFEDTLDVDRCMANVGDAIEDERVEAREIVECGACLEKNTCSELEDGDCAEKCGAMTSSTIQGRGRDSGVSRSPNWSDECVPIDEGEPSPKGATARGAPAVLCDRIRTCFDDKIDVDRCVEDVTDDVTDEKVAASEVEDCATCLEINSCSEIEDGDCSGKCGGLSPGTL